MMEADPSLCRHCCHGLCILVERVRMSVGIMHISLRLLISHTMTEDGYVDFHLLLCIYAHPQSSRRGRDNLFRLDLHLSSAPFAC